MLQRALPWPLALACLFLLGRRDLTGAGAEAAPRAEQVKAVFLYNFAQFVHWPEDAFRDPQSPLVIGVLGDDTMQPYLDEVVRHASAGGHRLVARHFARLEDVAACNVLYVAAAWPGDPAAAIRRLRGQSILTVGETAAFSAAGGMIRLIFGPPRTRIRVDLPAVKAARLTISSQLLRFAEITGEGEG